MVDTSLLIDHFRKTKRETSRLYQLTDQYDLLAVSAVTEFEVLVGATEAQALFWTALLAEIQVLPFDSRVVQTAVAIKQGLKKRRKSIDTADLFIAATAIASDLPFDTLNRKHFIYIEQLRLVPDPAGPIRDKEPRS